MISADLCLVDELLQLIAVPELAALVDGALQQRVGSHNLGLGGLHQAGHDGGGVRAEYPGVVAGDGVIGVIVGIAVGNTSNHNQ